MDQKIIFLTILGMALVTYIPRLLPVWLLSSRSLPPLVIAWLRYVPVAVLAAMLVPTLMIQDERVYVGLDNLFLWATIPTLLVAWKTKSFFSSVVAGMACVAIARYIFGI